MVKSGLGKTDGPFRATEDFNLNSTMQGTTTGSHSVENMELVSMCKPVLRLINDVVAKSMGGDGMGFILPNINTPASK